MNTQLTLDNMNRVLIFTLTSAGMLMDGYHYTDILCIGSLIIWLWLPAINKIEIGVLKRVNLLQKRI